MNLWLIPIFPFAGFLINGLFGRRLSKPLINLFAVGSVALSFAWAVSVLLRLSPLETKYIEHYYTWIQSGALNISIDFAVDRLTAVMLMVVTGVGLLIHIYSVGYMAEEGGYYRFFCYLNLFMFFMLVLVLAQNFLLLFVGWEGVGLCSYLLIGFFLLEQYATNAGNKAFIVNRIGDFGFSLAIFLIVRQFGSLDFTRVFDAAKTMPTEASAGILTTICLLLLVGATGKSALSSFVSKASAVGETKPGHAVSADSPHAADHHLCRQRSGAAGHRGGQTEPGRGSQRFQRAVLYDVAHASRLWSQPTGFRSDGWGKRRESFAGFAR